MKCPHCSADNKDTAKFCGKCGQSMATLDSIENNTKPCPGCSHACKSDAKFCPKCRNDFAVSPSVESKAESTVVSSPPVSVSTIGMMPCPHCHASVKIGSKFCGKCGKVIETTASESEAKEIISEPSVVVKVEPAKITVEAKPNPSPVMQKSEDAKSLPPKSDEKVSASYPGNTGAKIGKPTSATARKLPVVPIAAGVVALAVAIGAGSFILMKDKRSEDITKISQAIPTAQPALSYQSTNVPQQPVQSPSQRPGQDVDSPSGADSRLSTAPSEPEIPVPRIPVEKPATTDTASQTKKPEKRTVTLPSASGQANPLQVAIDASLEEGNKCMLKKKFDCSIGNANTVLKLDPSNARAVEMKRKSREAQERALSQIEIQ